MENDIKFGNIEDIMKDSNKPLKQAKNAIVRNFGVMKINKGLFSKNFVISIDGLGYLGIENGKLTFSATEPLVVKDPKIMINQCKQFYDNGTERYDQVEAIGFKFNGKAYYIDVAGRIALSIDKTFHQSYMMYHCVMSDDLWQLFAPDSFKLTAAKEIFVQSDEGNYYDADQKAQMETYFVGKMKKIYNKKLAILKSKTASLTI